MRVATHNLDPAQDFFRRFLAELGKLLELAVLSDALEIFQGLDSQLGVNQLNLFCVERRDADEICHTRRYSLA
jgi:hypothetical protein